MMLEQIALVQVSAATTSISVEISTSLSACKDSDVRLYPVDGSRENEGLVQYCHSGQWGVVCYDDWDNNDATVVCRQLGFNVEGMLFANIYFFTTTTFIFLYFQQMGLH